MRFATAWLLVLLAAGSALLIGGTAPFGRLALSLGLEGPAGRLLEDPLWRGVALYRSGAFEEAAEAFRLAGPRASFDRGNALAFAGRFDEAAAAYDAVIFRDPDDEEAHANRALIAPFTSRILGEARAGGRTEAAADAPAEEEAGLGSAPVATLRHEDIVPMLRKLYRGTSFTGQSIIASRQWLASLPDEPGRYLKLRLAAEHQRRIAQGTAVAAGGDPW